MPLSELHRAATRGKLEPPQSKMSNCTSDVSSFMPDHDFVELLWENGQIVMQGQSNRPKKTSFPSNSLRVNEKDGRDPTNQKFGQFEPIDSTVNDFSPAVPCANIGLNTQDDDMVPWMSNYPIEDPFSSEFFSELAGINPNSPLIERNSGSNLKDLHNVEHGQTPCRARTNNSFQSSQQCQSSVMNTTKSRLNEFGNGGSSSGSAQQAQLLKQDLVSSSKPLHPSGGFGLMNFSHFARPVALAKANMESSDRLRSNEKTLSKDSTLGESSAKTGRKLISTEPSETIRYEDGSKNNHHNNGKLPENQINHQSSSFNASIALGKKEAEKKPEAVVASSVCSGNSAGAASNDPKNRGKRKNREGEESGYQSEDLDDESFGVKKPTVGRGGMSTKRSRAAEVHNLSERRRRDRINEKMRALQELIPNCNKVDKASMLDEAIEYLKTLQLQVQMMSMGNGLCMSPMMLPPGMQHLRAPPMAHFSPMGLGMGMGMGLGYGMGMLDMSGSPNCPLIPVPMHTSQFPGATGLQLFGMTGSGQGLPMSMPRAPLPFTPLSNLTPKGNSVNEVGGTMGNPLPVSDTSLSAQQQCINLEAVQKPSGNEQKLAKESLDTSHLSVSASNRKS